MKRFLPLAALLLPMLVTSCQYQPTQTEDHWNLRSSSPRLARHLTGYSADTDGTYLDYQWEKKRHVNMAFRRHVLSWNPDNPFQADDPSLLRPRPVNSILPHPHHYLHPTQFLDSIIGTLSPGGVDEFVEGLAITLRPIGVLVTAPLDATLGEWTDNYAGHRYRDEPAPE